MTNKMCHNILHMVLFIFSLLLFPLATTSTSINHQLVPAATRYKCIEKERDALLDFKAHIQDPNIRLSTWTTEKKEDYECCNWTGVTCNNQTGHVLELDLLDYSLKGKISPSLANLSYLSYLNLGSNYFSGSIRSYIGSLTRLTDLDLSFNSFSGTIPSSIGSLTRLKYLDLSYNSFSGTIPSSNLTDLDISNNYFNGTIPLSIGSLTRLTHLGLSHNYVLNGTCIPQEVGNLTNLQYLSLKGFTSCIVENLDWLSRMSDLNYLIMDGISLGKVDKWVNTIRSLQKLSFLSLSGCNLSQVMHPYSSSFLNSSSSIDTLYLDDNNLNSSMYQWLLPLTSNKLRTLDLSKNMLDGKSFGNLCSLESLNFSYNSIAVKLPDLLNNWSGCTSVALQILFASYSRITGSLSDEIQMFTSLKDILLDHNELNGSISEKVWELPKLRSLDMSSNYLRGVISENIRKSKLYSIDLSNNSIKGVFSEAHMSNFFSYVNQIRLSSCNLGPRFPKWILNFRNLNDINIANNRISDTIPVEFWKNWPSKLIYLNLSTNHMNGEVTDLLSGFDPQLFSQIDLSSNNFSGQILNVPPICTHLDLSRNKFHGGLSFLCQIGGLLRYLDLSHNSFIGKIPECLWYLEELEVLNLGYNNLFGMLPASVKSLIGLEVLSLYNNNLSGEFPLSLKNCTKLTFLDLGSNKFTGSVPHWIGENLSRLYVLSLTSNKFLGPIPLQLCKLANLQILDLSMNNLYGTIPSCVNNFSSMAQEGFLPQQNVHRVLKQPGSSHEEDFYVDRAMIHWQGNLREFSTNLRFLKNIDLSQNSLTGQIPHEITHLSLQEILAIATTALATTSNMSSLKV